MTRAEFHRIYEQTENDFRAELIGGVVYVASPLKRQHGKNHLPLGTLFFAYESRTPGVEAADNATVILSDNSEPQPDLFLRILEECGCQSRATDDDYILGAPELVAEISHSTRSIDLHDKYDDYARHGVLEYLVVCLEERQLRWFDLQRDDELQPDADGICRMHTFPGLWIHGAALLNRDFASLTATLERGLASPEHREFVSRLESERKSRSGGTP
jgi:Uma2 family endonuclease